MTVSELVENLDGIPEDAIVILKHQLVGNENYAKSIRYEKDNYRNPQHGVLWIEEDW